MEYWVTNIKIQNYYKSNLSQLPLEAHHQAVLEPLNQANQEAMHHLGTGRLILQDFINGKSKY